MKPGPAVALTLVIVVLSAALSEFVHFPVLLLVVPATAIWAVSDVISLRQKYTNDPSFAPSPAAAATLQTSKPFIVFAACFLVWFFGFPWYLVMRGKLVAGAPTTNKENYA